MSMKSHDCVTEQNRIHAPTTTSAGKERGRNAVRRPNVVAVCLLGMVLGWV